MSERQRVLWVDATQGASGDMILGCLVDLGVSVETLRKGLAGLPLAGFSIDSRRLRRCAIDACKVDVRIEGDPGERGWQALVGILEQATLDDRVRERARAIFRRLIEAEAQVHGRSPDEVHLHEAGGTDAIIDVVGACLGLEELDLQRIVVSPMTTGFGSVKCAHGLYPVPAPATILLACGAPVVAGTIEAERLTPTGAAILTTLADGWGTLPPLRPCAVGYGAGERDLGESPNMLRMIVGLTDDPVLDRDGAPEVAVIECTLDDSTPQVVAFAAERLFAAGALDVLTTAVIMKKGRAGHHLTVLARPERLAELSRVVFEETSTLGLRFRVERRIEMKRSACRVETAFGPIEVKVGELDGRVVQAWPEYDQCAELARRGRVPLRQVQEAAMEAYRKGRPRVP